MTSIFAWMTPRSMRSCSPKSAVRRHDSHLRVDDTEAHAVLFAEVRDEKS